jgi:hypothetical protein
MTVTRYQIGRPIGPFPLIKSMTSRICGIPEPEIHNEPDSSNRISTVFGSSQDEPRRLRIAGNDATPAVVEVPKLGFGG